MSSTQKTPSVCYVGKCSSEEPFVLESLSAHTINITEQFQRPAQDAPSVPPMRVLGEGQFSLTKKAVKLQGELVKYRPGLSQDFIPRWCILTSECFLYYKSLFACKAFPHRPLGYCQLNSLSSVQTSPELPVARNFTFELMRRTEDEISTYSRTSAGFRLISHEEDAGTLNKHSKGWSARELEWYSADKRLVFGARNRETRAKWVAELRRLVS